MRRPRNTAQETTILDTKKWAIAVGEGMNMGIWLRIAIVWVDGWDADRWYMDGMGGGLDSRPRRGGGKYVQIKSNKKRDAKMKMNFMSINMTMKMGEKWSKERRQRTRTKATTQGPFGSGTTYSAFCCAYRWDDGVVGVYRRCGGVQVVGVPVVG